MKLKWVLVLIILFASISSTFGQKPEWLKNLESIQLLHSSRSDIEKAFGEPANPSNKYNSIYKLRQGKLSVEYSHGPCSEASVKGWEVAELTVTRLFFFPKEFLTLENLKMDLSGFTRSESLDTVGAYGYTSEEIGIEIDVTSKGSIEAIEFYPSKKFDALRCRTQ